MPTTTGPMVELIRKVLQRHPNTAAALAGKLGQEARWRRSERLAVEVHRFQLAKWPRWSSLHQAPSEASPLEEALFEAFRSHERVPGTAMQLHNIAGHCRTS